MKEFDLNPQEEKLLARGRVMVIVKLSATALTILLIIALAIFIITEPPGKVHVSCNIKGARILMDSYPTEFVTDAAIVKIPSGTHLFTVEMEGYRIIGDFTQKIKVTPGSSDSINFHLEKIENHDEP